MKKPKILWLYRQDTAVGYYRARLQAGLAKEMGYDVTFFNRPWWKALVPKKKTKVKDEWPDLWLQENVGRYDLLMVDRAVSNREWSRWAGYRHYSEGCRMVMDTDDLFTGVPWWNPAHKRYQPGQESVESGLNHMRNAEMVTVSTKALGKALADKAHAVRVVHNRIDLKDWEGLEKDPDRASDDHVRVLYGGAAAHFGDLEDVRQGLEVAIRQQWVPWRLMCFGSLPDWMQEIAREMPGKVVAMPWVTFEEYASVAAWGGFDFAIAPLKEDPFNDCKSNIKWLEAAAQRIPLLCSDVGPYQTDVPDNAAIKIDNTPAQWAEAMQAMLKGPEMRAEIADRAYEALCDGWTIDSGREELQIVIEEALARPRIESAEDMRLPSDPPAVQPFAAPSGGLEPAEVAPSGGPDCDDPSAGTAGDEP